MMTPRRRDAADDELATDDARPARPAVGRLKAPRVTDARAMTVRMQGA